MKLDLKQLGFFAIGCVLSLAPVFGGSWLVSWQAQKVAVQHLEAQLLLARNQADSSLYQLAESLNALASASLQRCSADQLVMMRDMTLASASMSALMVLDQAVAVACASPDLADADWQSGNAPVLMRNRNLSLGEAGIGSSGLGVPLQGGILLEFRQGDVGYGAFIPLAALPGLFSSVDPDTGLALILGQQTLFSRAPVGPSGAPPGSTDGRSVELAFGPINLQVSIDPSLVEARYQPIKQWVMLVGILVGALIVLLVGRIIHYTPQQLSEMERAIEHDEFVPFYQPTIDIFTGRLVGCEVLVRWRRPDGSMVSPGAFIALAERSGLAVPMTRKLMQAIVRDLGAAYAQRPDLKVAINLFNQHFNSLDIIDDVEAIFGPSPIAYGQLVMEITERTPLESISEAKIIMRKLQRLGCRMALDDAGTGHGGLAYLQELGLDIVKIDKMFIDQLGKSRIGESITQTLSELAQQLDMDVVAEGVETFEQVGHLRRLGIREAQGYLFAPALPAVSYLALVDRLARAPAAAPAIDPLAEELQKAATMREATRRMRPDAA